MQGIIRDTSSKIQCSNSPTYIKLKLNSSDSIIVYKIANTYHEVKQNEIKFREFN